MEQGTHEELLDSHGYYEELYLHSQGQKQERGGRRLVVSHEINGDILEDGASSAPSFCCWTTEGVK